MHLYNCISFLILVQSAGGVAVVRSVTTHRQPQRRFLSPAFLLLLLLVPFLSFLVSFPFFIRPISLSLSLSLSLIYFFSLFLPLFYATTSDAYLRIDPHASSSGCLPPDGCSATIRHHRRMLHATPTPGPPSERHIKPADSRFVFRREWRHLPCNFIKRQMKSQNKK